MTGSAPDPAREWVRVCRVAEVPEGYPLGVVLRDPAHGIADVIGEGGSDRNRVCVTRVGAGFQGMLDRCPHRDVRLSGGVVRDGLLTCPGHFWRFDLTDGHRTDLPEQVVNFYPTKVEDDWVWVQLPDEVPPMSMREWLLQQASRDRAVQSES